MTHSAMIGPQTLTCIAHFTALPGQEHALKQALLALIEPTHHEPGCLYYQLHESLDDPAQLVMVEHFQDQAAFEYHSQQPYLLALKAQLPALAASVSVNTYRVCR